MALHWICPPIEVRLEDDGVLVDLNTGNTLAVPVPGGPPGRPGDPGPAGPGVPPGGAAGQYFRKASSTDYDGEWADLPAPPVQSVNGKTGPVELDAEDVGALPDTTPLFSGDYDDLTNKPSIPSPQTSGTPANLGTAARGSATTYSRSDHVHAMPTASDVGALPSGTTASDIGALPNTTTAADIGGMSEWELLWTNASPTSDFAAQTIALDLSGYDFVMVIYKHWTTENVNNSAFCRIGQYGRLLSHDYTLAYRDYHPETTGVYFNIGLVAANYNNPNVNQNAAAVIPLAIYGLKGVMSV